MNLIDYKSNVFLSNPVSWKWCSEVKYVIILNQSNTIDTRCDVRLKSSIDRLWKFIVASELQWSTALWWTVDQSNGSCSGRQLNIWWNCDSLCIWSQNFLLTKCHIVSQNVWKSEKLISIFNCAVSIREFFHEALHG